MRLIDADKLKKKKKYLFKTQSGAFPKSEYFFKIDDILSAPTVKAEIVTYCKECEHLLIDDRFTEGRICKFRCCSIGCDDDDFCKYGTPKKVSKCG